MEFEWDLPKEMVNVRKHGVTFSEAVESSFDPNGLQLVDMKHSREERRFYRVGWSPVGRVPTAWIYPPGPGNTDHRGGESSGDFDETTKLE